MENNNNKLTAADIMQWCKSIILTDGQGVKHGMAAWVTFDDYIVSVTEYHKVLDGLFDLVMKNISDADISVNYRFCNNRIIVMGGVCRWMESYGMQLEKDDRWAKFLVGLEVADLPTTLNFAEFMRKMEEFWKSGVDKDDFYPISMTLLKKPRDIRKTEKADNLVETMKTVRGATSGKNKQPLKNRAMELTEMTK